MSKMKVLRTRLMRDGGIVAGAIAVSVGVLMGVGSFTESSETKKTTATGQFNQQQGQLATLKSQIEKAGTAEKRYAEIVAARKNQEFVTSNESVKNLMRELSAKYRFQENFKLTIATEKVEDKPEFSGLNYVISQRSLMRIELGAMSDMHLFSFVQEMLQTLPGLVRVTKWEMSREKDIDTFSLQQMSSGQTPEVVKAAIEFTWVGIAPKPKDANAGTPSAPGGNP